jgi:hypothetical protein
MRLTTEQANIIKQKTAKVFGDNARVFLFGSRVDDTKKGGDIDLFIDTTIDTDILKKAQLKNLLEAHLQLPVDILTVQRNTPLTPFQKIAFTNSVQL